MTEKTLTVNALAAKTWYWLKMNDTSVRVQRPEPLAVAAEGEVSPAGAEPLACVTGMGEELTGLLAESPATRMRVDAKAGEAQTVRLHLAPNSGATEAAVVDVRAAEGADLTLVMDCDRPAGAKGATVIAQTRLHLGKGAKVRLIQLWLNRGQDVVLNDIGAVCGEKADFALSQIYLGAEKVYAGAEIALEGAKSQTEVRQTYQAEKNQRFDFNDNVRHIGRKTVCRIDVSGVLNDGASKLFRGTIDLQKGAVGADGAEYENVLMLGEAASNQTIPLILCSEEDVKGNHGATIGRLDEGLLFYLTSRGLSEEQVCEMIASARLNAACEALGDPRAACQVMAYANIDAPCGEDRDDA